MSPILRHHRRAHRRKDPATADHGRRKVSRHRERGEYLETRPRRILRIARRFITWAFPTVIRLCYGASLMSPVPVPPPHRWNADIPLASHGPNARKAARTGACRPDTPLSPAEQSAWERLVRDLGG